MVDVTIARRPYRLLLDTGAARTQLNGDKYTSALRAIGEHESSASFGSSVIEPVVTITDLAIGPLQDTEAGRGPQRTRARTGARHGRARTIPLPFPAGSRRTAPGH